MDLTGWKCSKYSLQKGEYIIHIMCKKLYASFGVMYQVCDKSTSEFKVLAEFSGLSDAITHVEKLLNKKDNV